MKIRRHTRFYFDWDTTRIETLTDGVFAIAMTLLVLNFGIEKPFSEDTLHHKIMALWPDFVHYVESFIILSAFWTKHHQQFHLIKKTDRWLMWLNNLGLLFICLIPFSTSLAGDYGRQRVAVLFFELNMFFAGMIFYWQWAYASKKRRLIDKNTHDDIIAGFKFDNLVVPVISLIAIAISVFNTRIGTLVYILIPLFFLLSKKAVDKLEDRVGSH